MARFTRVEIHFTDKELGQRRVVITPDSGIEAIFLRGSERQIMKDVTPIQGPPGGAILEGTVFPAAPQQGIPRGPGEVCYLKDGVLLCWDPEE